MNRRIFILRHGNTFGPGDTPRRIGAGTDLPLVQSGRDQADCLGAHLATLGQSVSSLHSSNLSRARETAERVGTALKHGPDGTLPWLNEIDHGPDEGQPEDVVTARIGVEAIERWDRDAIPPPGWVVDADTRIAAWRAYVHALPAGDHIMVTSNGAARFALLAMGLTLNGLKLRTGAYGQLVIDAQGRVTVAGWDMRPDA